MTFTEQLRATSSIVQAALLLLGVFVGAGLVWAVTWRTRILLQLDRDTADSLYKLKSEQYNAMYQRCGAYLEELSEARMRTLEMCKLLSELENVPVAEMRYVELPIKNVGDN